MKGTNVSTNPRDAIRQILRRYRDYEDLIGYPGDWGERAFRFWLIKELFMDVLGWRTEYIVFGEKYDVLLLDKDIRPRVYVETKNPDVQVVSNYIKRAIERAEDFFSIDYVVVTNGITWVLFDCIRRITLRIDDIERANKKNVEDFFNRIRAKRFVGPKWGLR